MYGLDNEGRQWLATEADEVLQVTNKKKNGENQHHLNPAESLEL